MQILKDNRLVEVRNEYPKMIYNTAEPELKIPDWDEIQGITTH